MLHPSSSLKIIENSLSQESWIFSFKIFLWKNVPVRARVSAPEELKQSQNAYEFSNYP